ncbi:MAG: DUF885 domain-containing protein, partial [Planctomycetota bacterium]|nr:DUF885 domain-containing protein [Planctomycetota bacterium]
MDKNKDQRFENLAREFFTEWARRNPIEGSNLGFYSECNHRMPDGSYEKIQDDIRFLKRYETEFNKISVKHLSTPLVTDHALAISVIENKIYELDEFRSWERIPTAATVMGEAIFQILSRNFAPLKNRLKQILKRLEEVPRYLQETRSCLRDPIKIFVENELETLTRLPGFFNTLKILSWDNLPKAPQKHFLTLLETSQNALEKYSDWLIVDILPECRDDYPIGEVRLRKLLKARGIHENPKDIQTHAEKEMKRLQEKLKDLAKKIKKKVAVEDIRELIKQQHPDNFDGILRFTRDKVQKARKFVVRSEFAEIPPEESVFIVETPAHLRHVLPHGTYHPPARMDKSREGYFHVTPGDCDSNKLKEHNFAALSNLTIHESYPGHHLQASWTMAHPSLLRAMGSDRLTLEGWAHYCEERIKDLGFDDEPPFRFMSTMSQMFRAVRALLDIKLATGQVGFDEGADFLIDHVGLDRVAAEAEMRRYMLAPGEALTGLVGKSRMKELRKWTKEKMKGRFTDRFFHDAVLKTTPLPFKILQKELTWRIEEELAKPVVKEAPPAAKKKK